MVLEYLLNEKIQSKSYYIIDFDKQTEVNIGRGSQCQLKLKDISISRNHACLQLKKGQIYFSDKQSKFGSLVYLQDSIKAQPETMYNIQCGRTTISLQIKQKSLDIQQILKRKFQMNKEEHKAQKGQETMQFRIPDAELGENGKYYQMLK